MVVQLGDEAPNFTAETTEGEIDFHEFIGDGWAILFSHPKDFTPVCTTELGALARMKDEFTIRDTVVIGLSVDPLDSHEVWVEDIEATENVKMNFPIIADPERVVAGLYGMIHPKADRGGTVRSVFIIGPDKTVRLVITYPQSTGRDFNEVLRTLDSLQLFEKYKVATPAQWRQGEDVIIAPTVSDSEAMERFPEGWTSLTPYMRMVPQPK